MSHPGLDPDLTAALQLLEHGLGPLQVLDVHSTPPRRRPATPPPASAGADSAQPSLFDPAREPEPAPPATSATDPFSHLPPRRRWRAVPRHARPPAPAHAPSTWRTL